MAAPPFGPPGHGQPPGGYGPPGHGQPPGGYGPPGHGQPPYGYGPPGHGQPPYGGAWGPPQGPTQPSWLRPVALASLALGVLLAIGTIAGGVSSESLGVTMAHLTAGPLGFGIVATIMSRRQPDGRPVASTGAALGCGCGTGLMLFIGLFVFFAAIWPML